jgi:hypothetical protein
MGRFLRFLKTLQTGWDTLNGNPTRRLRRQLFEAMSVMCEDGVDADELPNGSGEFGMSPSNPIPCRTILGSADYLGRLRASDGTKVLYRRVGSVASDRCAHPVDIYETSHPRGHRLATLFLSPYQKRSSHRAPRGFKLVGGWSAQSEQAIASAPLGMHSTGGSLGVLATSRK